MATDAIPPRELAAIHITLEDGKMRVQLIVAPIVPLSGQELAKLAMIQEGAEDGLRDAEQLNGRFNAPKAAPATPARRKPGRPRKNA